MKKYMTTFEMAQAAFENPGKVFVSKDDGLCVTWSLCSKTLIYPHSGHTVNLYYCQRSNYVWNEKVEPRKWSGEYERNERGGIAGDDCGAPFAVIPHGVKARVKWEAEEIV